MYYQYIMITLRYADDHFQAAQVVMHYFVINNNIIQCVVS